MGITQRPLTEDEKTELVNLNAAVTAAIEARRTWLDAKMHECSHLQVGDDIYDVIAGRKLGTVTELYRAGRNDLLDDGVHCNYRYDIAPGVGDNTSRQSGLFGTRDDALAYAEMRLAGLMRPGTGAAVLG